MRLCWDGKKLYFREYFKEYLLNSIENLCEEIYNLEDLTDRSDIFRSPLMIFLLVSSFYHKLQGRKVYPEFFSGFFWNSPLVGGGLCILGTEGGGAEWRWEDDSRCSMMTASWGEVRSGLQLLLVLSISPSWSRARILKSFPQQTARKVFIYFHGQRERSRRRFVLDRKSICWCEKWNFLLYLDLSFLTCQFHFRSLLPAATRYCTEKCPC